MGTFNQADIYKPFLKKRFDTLCYFLTLIFFSFFSPALYAQIPATFCDGNPADWANYTTTPDHPVVYIKDAANSMSDDQFTGGSMDPDEISDWHWVNGNTNDKTDITNAGAQLVDGCILRVFADRTDNSGDASIGFWTFKDAISLNSDGTFSGVHTNGDILIVMNFTNGGTTPTIAAYVWVDGSLIQVSLGSNGCAGVNADAAPVPAPLSYTPKMGESGTYPPLTFFEGAIDLCELNIKTCFASFLAETRHSQSINASLDDLAGPGSFNTNPNAPTVEITQQPTCATPTGCLTVTSPVGEGFTYSLDNGAFVTKTEFCDLTPGEHCIRVKNSGGCISDKTCKTLNTPSCNCPTCHINTPYPLPGCYSTGNTLCATTTGTVATYQWSVSGTGWAITGGQGTPCITYSAGIGTATFTLIVSNGGETPCPSTCYVTFSCKGTVTKESCPVSYWKGATGSWNQGTDQISAHIASAKASPYNGNGTTSALFRATFGLTSAQMTAAGLNANLTLLQAISTSGTGCNSLLRNSVAALLNSSAVKYTYTTAQVLTMTHNAIINKACGTTANKLATANSTGNCPMVTIANNQISQSSEPAFDDAVKSDRTVIKAYPNPYMNQINFSIKSPVSGKATLEVYSILGQKLAIVYDGKVDAGIEQRVIYNVPAANRVTMMYRLTIGNRTYWSTVIPVK